jgi:hypothetical protein
LSTCCACWYILPAFFQSTRLMFALLDVSKAFFLAASLRQYSCICTGIAFALAVHDGRHTTACLGALSPFGLQRLWCFHFCSTCLKLSVFALWQSIRWTQGGVYKLPNNKPLVPSNTQARRDAISFPLQLVMWCANLLSRGLLASVETCLSRYMCRKFMTLAFAQPHVQDGETNNST